jgi:APA family basic amino acid/polyamine antiporter
MESHASTVRPKQLLSVPDGVFLVAGMVIGVGIFKAPGMVAGNSSSAGEFFFAWVLGGLASLCGALVYAELASRHPETGGEYAFLRRGFGDGAGFVFAWSRMTVIQTGAIAAVSFVFGEYATQLLPLGKHSAAVWAALCVVLLTGLNIAGTLQSKTLQKAMEVLLILSLAAIAVGGIALGGTAKPAPAAAGGGGFALMMIFVLYTFGGWNEGAYLAGEVREARRNMVKVLVGGILLVTALYLLVNFGYYSALGLQGMKESKAIASDAMRLIAGERAALLLALVVCVSAATTINAAIFTGARTTYALGSDFRLFSTLGRWRAAGSTPANALLAQGAIALALIAAGASTHDGFEAMVAYTLPVFWTFFLLTGLTLFVFRRRDAAAPQFRVPLYPIVPLAFYAMCLFMLWASVDYLRNPAIGPKFGSLVLAGLGVMAAGIPLYFLSRRIKGK